MVADTAELSGQADGGAAAAAGSLHYCEGAAALQLGAGFFRPESRPSRDLGVLLAALLARGELKPIELVEAAIERIVRAYLDLRQSPAETFLDAYRRVGMDPFKRALYGDEGHQDAA